VRRNGRCSNVWRAHEKNQRPTICVT
jgi:hypothetical protein